MDQPTTKVTNHYVNNTDFYNAIKEYKKEREEAAEKGLPPPRIPEYIGSCLLKIAEGLSMHPSFRGYSFKEEMISDGIENCMIYFNNFDPDKSAKPFAYFTQCMWFAFVRRISREQKQTYVRFKMMRQQVVDDANIDLNESDYGDYHIDAPEDNDSMKTFIDKFETRKRNKKKPADATDDTVARHEDNGIVDILSVVNS